MKDICYRTAETRAQYQSGKELFQQYAAALGIDLSFQEFQQELEQIDQQYGPPKGVLLLAYHATGAVGCAGVRSLTEDSAELKRMYVEPAYRRLKIGHQLLRQAIAHACAQQYTYLRLDTLAEMKGAQKLYRSFGFYEIPPYRYNPIEGTLFMEKKLDE